MDNDSTKDRQQGMHRHDVTLVAALDDSDRAEDGGHAKKYESQRRTDFVIQFPEVLVG